MIGLKNSRHFFIQSQVKPKPIVTCSHSFSRAFRQLHAITLSFGCFTWLSVYFVIGLYTPKFQNVDSSYRSLNISYCVGWKNLVTNHGNFFAFSARNLLIRWASHRVSRALTPTGNRESWCRLSKTKTGACLSWICLGHIGVHHLTLKGTGWGGFWKKKKILLAYLSKKTKIACTRHLPKNRNIHARSVSQKKQVARRKKYYAYTGREKKN